MNIIYIYNDKNVIPNIIKYIYNVHAYNIVEQNTYVDILRERFDSRIFIEIL